MWTLYREIPAGSNYNDLITESPNVQFEYFIDLDPNISNPETMNASSIIEWDRYWSDTPEKYGIARLEIQALVDATGWANLTDDEKYIAIKYRRFPTGTDAMSFLISKGLSYQNAYGYLVRTGATEQVRLIESCAYKGTSQVLFMIIGMYLSIEDQADLNELVRVQLNEYILRGLRGSNDGNDGNEGVFDFIEGTGTMISLEDQGYVMVNGDPDMTNFKNDLINWLRYGINPFE